MNQSAKSGIFERLDELNEFERAPIGRDALQPGRYFAGMFAGEHVAATEFVIGALFVSFGAAAKDVILGLILGNLLAVCSWAFLCAPIAVQTRLTLYWYLRKIGGPGLMVVYNVLNAFLHCILAGAMITVSASAVRLVFNIPAQTRWYPTDARFVLVVIGVGFVVVTLAILGFKRLAQFSSLCSPWMFVMFGAGAVVTLPQLGTIGSAHDLWQVASKSIWTGHTLDGSPALGFWHVVAFAWICNLATHVGLTDMALFRYARHWTHGFYSAFGMYLGHYLAWICAGVMGAAAAAALRQPLTELDSGTVAYSALGAMGALTVMLAGWTTANPTLYRVGLALQVITPGWPRWMITAVIGIITTAIACFPFVFTRMLDFVGLYGLVLMPVGAVVVVEHWVFPWLGWTRFWATRQGRLMNWPALVAWLVALAAATWLWQSGRLHLFFLALPIWLLTAVCYLVLAALAGARRPMPDNPADNIVPAPALPLPRRPWTAGAWLSGGVAMASLVALAVLAAITFTGRLTLAQYHWTSIPLTTAYFVAGLVWMRLRESDQP